eukprot:g5664.t1
MKSQILQVEQSPIKKELHTLKGVSFGGSGVFFWWELGCALWLLEHVDIDRCPCFGASGGALAATMLACKIDPFKVFEVANHLSEESCVFHRRLGVTGIWGELIRQWLDELLPKNANEICNDRVGLVITTLPKLEMKVITRFDSRRSLIDANLASCHIPFVLDGKMSTTFKGMECFDGSFHDFLTGKNSALLTCNGSYLNFDYFHDKRLNNKRLDFIGLKKPSERMNMIYLGYDYTEALSKTKVFENALLKRRNHSRPSPYQILQSSASVLNN